MAAEDTGKTFEASYGLTDEEIEWFVRATYQKQLKIAPFGRYIGWIVVAAGVVLAYSGGALVHGVYGTPLNSNAALLVMAFFVLFVGGAVAHKRLLLVWHSKLSDWRVKRHKETANFRMNKDGITVTRPNTRWFAAWDAIEDVAFTGGAVIFWYGADVAFMVPLRAIPADERSAFTDAAKTWLKPA